MWGLYIYLCKYIVKQKGVTMTIYKKRLEIRMFSISRFKYFKTNVSTRLHVQMSNSDIVLHYSDYSILLSVYTLKRSEDKLAVDQWL